MSKMIFAMGCGVTAFVLVCSIVGLVAWGFSLKNNAVSQETGANAQYLMNQNEMSAYKASFAEQFGVYAVTMPGLQDFVVNAAKGRYDKDYNPQTGKSESGIIDTNVFVKAVNEAYPETKGQTDLISKLMDYSQAGRTAFKNGQNNLIDRLAAYDSWRKQEPQATVLSFFGGTPTDKLEVRIGTQKFTGQSALDQMYLLVLTSDTLKAFQTGVDVPMVMPTVPSGNATAVPTRAQ